MSRESDGTKLFNDGLVSVDNGKFKISGKNYVVTSDNCSCPDHIIRQQVCKHMWAVRLFVIATNYKPTKSKTSDKYAEMIDYITANGSIISANELYLKYDDLVDEAIIDNIISRTAKQFVLIV